MRHNFNSIVMLIIFLTQVCIASANDGNKTCTRHEAIEAENAIDGLMTWEDIYGWFKRYKHCDDVSISEGFSDRAGQLLANQWKDFNTFAKMSETDKEFEQFVLLHLDLTIPADYYNEIINNTEQHCPAISTKLCDRILITCKQLKEEIIREIYGDDSNK